jgi:hypothetical protein
MERVIRLNLFDTFNRFLDILKGNKPLSDGKKIAETGIFFENGESTGKVTGTRLSGPAATETDILVLGYCKRLMNEYVIAVRKNVF